MELLHMHYFCKIVECGGMTNAAKELFVSQPSLSRVIAGMEAELGVPLFRRANRKLVPTAEGRFFYEKAKEALVILDDATARLHDLSATKQPKLSIAIMVNQPIMEELMREYRHAFPEIELELIRNGLNPEPAENEADLYLVASPLDCSQVECIDIYQQEAAVYVSKESKYADRESIRLSELAGEGFVLQKDRPFRRFTDSLCQYAGFIPRCVGEHNDFGVMSEIVKTENAVGFRGTDGWADLHMLRITDPKPFRYIRLAWRKDRYLNAAARQFIEFIQQGVQARGLDTMG